MKEWQRTIILVVLLAIAIGYLVWMRQTIDTSLLNGV